MVVLDLCSAAIHDVSYDYLNHCVGVECFETVVGQTCERVSLEDTQHVYVREEKWTVVCRVVVVVVGKRAKLNEQLCCARIRWRSRCAKGVGSVDSECNQASPSPRLQF